MSTSRLHYLRRCFISVSQFIWRVFARKQRRVLAASYLCVFYLCPDMFSVSLCVCKCVCVSVYLFSSHSSVFSGCLFQISVSVFCFSAFPSFHFHMWFALCFLINFWRAIFSFPPPLALAVPVTSVCHESRSKSAFYKDLLRVVPLQCRQTRTQKQTQSHYSDAQQCAPIAFDKRLFGCVAYQKAAPTTTFKSYKSQPSRSFRLIISTFYLFAAVGHKVRFYLCANTARLRRFKTRPTLFSCSE